MEDNYIIKSFIKMKITELTNELKVAKRNWKSRVEGELKAYKDIKEMLEVQEKADKKLNKDKL
jgi:hypothetical protein